jgi:tetratricopeptide (TPR) repeat protein
MFRRAGAAITPAICGVLLVTYQYKVFCAVVQIWAAAMQNVGDWLKELGLGQYAQRFADHDIEASTLSDLTDQDLEKIGVTLGHRKKLLRAIAALNGAGFVSQPARRSEAQRRRLTVMFADLAVPVWQVTGASVIDSRFDALRAVGRVDEGSQMLRQHQQIATANEWNYSALAVETSLELSRILRGEIKKGVMGLESIIQALEIKYSYQAYADFTRLLLAEFYIELLCGAKKLSIGAIMKSPIFILRAKRGASRRAETLLRMALRNPQISERGLVRARIYFNLGMIHKAMGRLDLAGAHFDEARKVASAQEATALIAKIDAAKASRDFSG